MQTVLWDGKKIETASMVDGLPIDTYHGDCCVGPSLSSSGVRTIFDKSLAHYFSTSYLNQSRIDSDETDALIFGRACHHLLLGQEGFSKHFTVRPAVYPDTKTGDEKPWNANATYCKAWLEKAQETGLTVLKGEQIEHIRGMAVGLQSNSMVQAGILNGLIEQSIIWKDKETGVFCKVRPDSIPTDSGDVSDLKSAADVSDKAIERTIGDRGYHVQAAMVGMALREVIGIKMTSFSLVFVEKTPPYCVRVKAIKDCDLELGEKQIRVALRMFARAVERDYWPGPGQDQSDAEFVEITPYKRAEIEFRLERLEGEMLL